MAYLARWAGGALVVAAVLAVLPPAGTGQDGTVPYGGPSLFCRRAEAASGWLPWTEEQAERLEFGELYSGASALGLELSPKLKGLAGRRVRMSGFMAPPLKPTLSFFVLTKAPMAICPFCSTDADWPDDIVLVRLARPSAALPFDRPIIVAGRLELGYEQDAETGFVSLVRIAADNVAAAE